MARPRRFERPTTAFGVGWAYINLFQNQQLAISCPLKPISIVLQPTSIAFQLWYKFGTTFI
jgi:hypothetical protein